MKSNKNNNISKRINQKQKFNMNLKCLEVNKLSKTKLPHKIKAQNKRLEIQFNNF